MILSLYLICILQALQPYLDTLLQLLRVTTEFTNLLAHRLDLQHLRQKIHFLCHRFKVSMKFPRLPQHSLNEENET